MNKQIQTKTKNRWLIAFSSVGIHASIGSVYAWSVFNKPLEVSFGWSKNEVALTFSIAILFLGFSAAILGSFVEKYGPRKSAFASAAFWSIGLIGSGYATSVGNLYLLWLCYGVIGGTGLGIGYIAPVSTLIKWFPDRRGLATGLAIMGFGFGAMIGAPVFNYLISRFGISSTFYIIGTAYLLIMFFSSLYLDKPIEGWMPSGMKKAIATGTKKITEDISQLTAKQAVRTAPFWGLWIMLFINISCGIAILYAASPLAQERIGLSAVDAAIMVGLMSLFNGLGRFGWASASDFLGRPITFMVFFAIQIVAFYMLPRIDNIVTFQVVLCLILTCYGGGFATIPAYIGDLFGTKQLGAIHGYVLTAWALAGLAGPQLAAHIRSTTGSYTITLYIFASLFVIAFIVSALMRKYVKRKHKVIDRTRADMQTGHTDTGECLQCR